ncbi:ribosome biogenesis protein Nop16 [Durotheca rogersii]|uniref:ribosome biogenesis protein Nop16 n=1 Tax=Durotheca rogersii TaxID=419775 RepID=UPI00221E9B63|nr:ribosome biogenesis protein Nop16 [Durotheca rogersii]KAI5862907.1 ribosome biogenesis protein Nop16 [Durotheca rogersii]
MGRDLQKRKRRSSRAAIRQPSSARRPKRALIPLGSSIVAKNWNKKETTTQNYRRLGLVGRLRAPTGGAEPVRRGEAAAAAAPADPFAIGGRGAAVLGEARVERDAAGRIVRVLRPGAGAGHPLGDALAALDSDSDADAGPRSHYQQLTRSAVDDGEAERDGVAAQLEAEARRPAARKPRPQSARETEWLRALVDRHGDDVAAMARDRRLNPMQQTPADLARRLRKMRQQQQTGGGGGGP